MKTGIIIDNIRYGDLPDSVGMGATVMTNRVRDTSGEYSTLTAVKQDAGELAVRCLAKRTWSLGWNDGMTDSDLYDHLSMLYANQRPFVFQYDALYSRNVAACQFVDPECTKWATPTYPIVPYNHDGVSAYDWSNCLLINNIRQSIAFDVDEAEGVVILPKGVADQNTRVQLRYDFRVMARVMAFEHIEETVVGVVRKVQIVLGEVGVPAFDCGAPYDEQSARTC